MDPTIIFEDKKIIVVRKPVGMLSQSDFTSRSNVLNWVKNYIKIKYSKPKNVYVGLVHRLDKEVGGIMVFAKNSKIASRLSESIREHEFSKRYLLVIEDFSMENGGVLDDYLIKNSKTNKTIIGDKKDGKFSSLRYKLIKHNGRFSLIEASLITGRSHQIRIQFASRGNPIIGDNKYGDNKSTDGNTGLALWAYKLSFPYPDLLKEKIEFINYPPNINPWDKFSFPL